MSFPISTRRPWRTAVASALLAGITLISACGGGSVVGSVGTGGTGAFSSGAISGLGSIVVNGVRYDDSAASVSDDGGNSSNSGSLKLGVVVEVLGDDIVTPATGLPTSNARSVVFRSEIKGPVTAVNAAAGTLTVLGQNVVVSASTVFDLNLPNGLASVAVGQLLEVYGFVDANGVYQATRIEGEDSASTYKIRGKLSVLNAAAKTFQIGAAVIDYSAINFNFTLVNGQTIRVELATTPNTLGQWVATRLNSATALGNAASSAATVELEGVVSSVASARSFVVDGITVDASGVNNFPAGVAVGSRVEVKGKLESGVLVASRVKLEDDDDREFEIKGNIAALDTTAKTFEIRGVLIAYGGATFKDGVEANLSVDVRVEIKGALNATGTVVTASEVEFKGLDDDKNSNSNGGYEVKGAISGLDTTAKTFVVRNVTVNYAAAGFEDGTAADLANGAVVEVKGTVSAGVLLATKVDFEDGSGSGGSNDDGDSYEIKGSITSVNTTAQTFVLSNGAVVAYAGASFEDGSAANLVVGAKVEVKGSASVNGVVTATRVEFDD
ncbi:MAG: DUF5666 domain-containing protein [Hydrogenophaga sp.]|nr:DUF5666 domain-containing protein [Hydrogenophaga sp.]